MTQLAAGSWQWAVRSGRSGVALRILATAYWLLPLVSGCGAAATEKPRGEAEMVLVSFYQALVHEDWSAAHAALHGESRALVPLDQFTHLARTYRQSLRFEPQEVRVRSCEEQEDVAIAHVVIVGAQNGRERSWRDAITLRRDGTRWGVVLPSRFGRAH